MQTVRKINLECFRIHNTRRRRPWRLLWGLDNLVKAGFISRSQALKLHKMAASEDEEMSNLGDIACREIWIKYREIWR